MSPLSCRSWAANGWMVCVIGDLDCDWMGKEAAEKQPVGNGGSTLDCLAFRRRRRWHLLYSSANMRASGRCPRFRCGTIQSGRTGFPASGRCHMTGGTPVRHVLWFPAWDSLFFLLGGHLYLDFSVFEPCTEFLVDRRCDYCMIR